MAPHALTAKLDNESARRTANRGGVSGTRRRKNIEQSLLRILLLVLLSSCLHRKENGSKFSLRCSMISLSSLAALTCACRWPVLGGELGVNAQPVVLARRQRKREQG